MKQFFVAFTLIVGLTSCESGGGQAEKEAKPSKEALVANVKALEDSLKATSSDLLAPNRDVMNRYADNCLAVYRNYPKSQEAPQYLDKAHVILSSAGLHGSAVMYADTLIRKYPHYKNRPMVLQSLASSYDLFIRPRKKEMVKYYYELLLKEDNGLTNEEKEQIRFRIDHVDLTFDQLLELQMQQADN